eukprot:CAMPEP_0172499960 /NCGR_PEP_ID=MMETSP1066-20121228/132943_1 /TAXON_ID=671091 /ORGANISM="Coscinodiscus wailesii, Strain CCMP2513" /LENGTH=46 /DNA_ID= /DNA_START= /DNA_END= /DNA_ORIENTATION=
MGNSTSAEEAQQTLTEMGTKPRSRAIQEDGCRKLMEISKNDTDART